MNSAVAAAVCGSWRYTSVKLYAFAFALWADREREFSRDISFVMQVFFNILEPFGAFRLLAEPHSVTQGFVLLQISRNVILLCLVIHEKNTV